MCREARRRTEAGQITAMLVIFAICLLMAVIAVTDISASYLRRQAATSLADGAALAATEAAAASSIYTDADDEGYVPLEPAAGAAAVDRYLAEVGAYTTYPGLRAAVTVEGHTVRVALSMPYELPVSMPGVANTITVHGTGSAALPIY